MTIAFQIVPGDNVATLLDDAGPGAIQVIGEDSRQSFNLLEAIPLGHKIALRPIAAGHDVVKFGVAIGVATADISAGAWVHLHNCKSRVDERSPKLAIRTNTAMDLRHV